MRWRLMVMLLLFGVVNAGAQTTSYYELKLRSSSTGQLVPGKNVDLYQSGVKIYDLTESSTVPGVYYNAAVENGMYDIYVDASLYKGSIWIGSNKVTIVTSKFDTSGYLTDSTTLDVLADSLVDGVTIIKNADGKLVSIGDSTSLRFNITSYGATANDVSDDTDEIQAAIDAIRVSSGGGMLYVPEGEFIISDTLSTCNNLHIYGKGSIRRVKSGADYGEVFRVRNDTNVVFTGITMKADQASMFLSEHDHCISISNSKNVRVEDCNFPVCAGDGIYVTTSSIVKIVRNYFYGDSLNSAISTTRNGISVVDGDDIEVANNDIWGFTIAGIDFEPNAGEIINNFSITNNKIHGKFKDSFLGISLNAALYNTGIEKGSVSYNQIDSTSSSALWIRAVDDSPSHNSYLKNVTVDHNIITNCNYTDGQSANSTVYVHGYVQSVNVESNELYNNSELGIYVGQGDLYRHPSGVNIVNNIIKDQEQHAIALYAADSLGAPANLLISKNNIDGAGENFSGIWADRISHFNINGNNVNNTTAYSYDYPIYINHADSGIVMGNYFTTKTGNGAGFLNCTDVFVDHNFDSGHTLYNNFGLRHSSISTAEWFDVSPGYGEGYGTRGMRIMWFGYPQWYVYTNGDMFAYGRSTLRGGLAFNYDGSGNPIEVTKKIPSDNQILKFDSAVDSLMWEDDGGSGGGTDYVAGNNIIISGDTLHAIDTQKSREDVQDDIGAAIDAGTQSGITVTYNDAGNKIDFSVTGGGGTANYVDSVRTGATIVDVDDFLNTSGEIINLGAGSGVTLDDFDNQTNWRTFYSDGSGDVTELALGAAGSYLKSQGASSAPTWDTPIGFDIDTLRWRHISGIIQAGTNLSWMDSTLNASGGSSVVDSLDLEFRAENAKLGHAYITGTPASITGSEFLVFDASTDNQALFIRRIRHYTGGTISVEFDYRMASATSGNVVFTCSVMAVGDGESLSSTSFAAAQSVTDAVPGTAGLRATATVTLTQAQADNLATNDYAYILITRDADNGSDTASGNAYVGSVLFHE